MKWDIGSLSLDLKNLWEFLQSKPPKAQLILKGEFYDWVDEIPKSLLSEIGEVVTDLKKRFDRVLCIGIGGSHLGPFAVQEALRQKGIHWLSNIDPDSIRAAETFVQKHGCATVVISKSGTTTETLAGFFHLSKHLDPQGIVVITDPIQGELRRLAKQEGWKSFEVPQGIGGRYSVLTPVGLLPVALGGGDAKKLIQGAVRMKRFLEACPAENHPISLYATALYEWDLNKRSIHYFMPYTECLRPLADWFVQLMAESLGKKEKGFTPISAVGTRDQHSILQLIKEGPHDKIVGFVELPDDLLSISAPSFKTDPNFNYLTHAPFSLLSNNALRATQKSLHNSGVPTYSIRFEKIDEDSLGEFFFFMEVACVFLGGLYGVNVFDQPGVEESKRLFRESLEDSK